MTGRVLKRGFFMAMNKPTWIKIAAFSAALSVVLGAFGAHGLEGSLTPRSMATFNTAVHYQFLHSLALFAVVSLPDDLVNIRMRTWAARAFLVGMIIFSGSLYLLLFTGLSWLGIITPLGGIAFISGWALIFFSVKRSH